MANRSIFDEMKKRNQYGVTPQAVSYDDTLRKALGITTQYARQSDENRLDVANTLTYGGVTALKPGDISSWDWDTARDAQMSRVASDKYFQGLGMFDTEDYAYNKAYTHLTSTDYLKRLMASLEAENAAWANGGEEEYLAFTQRNNAVKNKLADMDAQGRNYYDTDALTEADLLWFDQVINGNERWKPNYASQEDVDRYNALVDQWGSVDDWENFDLAQYLGIEAPKAYDDSNYKIVSDELNRRSALQAMQASIRGEENYGSLSAYTGMQMDEDAWLTPSIGQEDIRSFNDLYSFLNNNPSWEQKSNAREKLANVARYMDAGYDYISADELADYNALINAGRLEEAEQYLELLRPELLYRRAMVLKEYQSVKATNPWLATPTWLEAGVQEVANIFSLPQQIYETATGRDNPYSSAYDAANKSAWTSEAQIGAINDADIPDWLDKAATLVYQGVSGFRDNTFRIIAGGGNPTAALIIAGAQSGSRSLQESSERSDMSAAAKIVKAIGTAAIEVGTEKIGLDALFDKGKSGALQYIKGVVLSEMGEESLNYISEPALEAAVAFLFDHEAEIMSGPEFWQGLTDTLITTGISSIFMGGGGAIAQDASTRATGSSIQQHGDVEGVLRIAESMPEDSESFKSAVPVREAVAAGKKISNRQLGKMVTAIAKDIGEQNATTVNSVFEDSIQERLVELGEDSANAKKLAPVIRNMYQGKKITKAERAAIDWTDNASQVFREMHTETDAADGQSQPTTPAWKAKADNRVQQVAVDTFGKSLRLREAMTTKSSTTDTAASKAKERAQALTNGKAKMAPKAIAYDDGTEGGKGTGEFKRVVKRGKDTFVAIAKDGGETVEIPVDKLTSVGDEGLATIIEYAAYESRHEMSTEEANILVGTYAQQGGDAENFILAFEASYLSGYSGIDAAPSAMAPELAKIAYEHGRAEAAADEAQRVARAKKNRNVANPTVGWLGDVSDSKQVKGLTSAGSIDDAVQNMTESQQTVVAFMREFAKQAHINVMLFNSKANAEGKLTTQNGSYDPNTHTVYIDVNAGANTAEDIAKMKKEGTLGYAVMRTLGHEVTHAIESSSGEYYAKYKQAVKNTLSKKGRDWSRLVREKIDSSIAAGEKLTYAAAEAEVVADASEYMLQDSSFVKNMDKGLAGKVKAIVQDFVDKINKVFEHLGVTAHIESQLLRDIHDGVAHYTGDLQKLWDAAMNEMVSKDASAATADGEQMEADGEQAKMQNSNRLLAKSEYGRFISNWNSRMNGNYFTPRPNGGVLIAMGDLLVYTDKGGAPEHVLEVLSTDIETNNDIIQRASLLETEGFDYEEQAEVLERVFPEGSFRFRLPGDGDRIEESIGRDGGRSTRKVRKAVRENLPSERDPLESEVTDASPDGIEIDEESGSAYPTQNSIRTWAKSDYVTHRDEAAQRLANTIGVSVSKAAKWIDDVNSISAYILGNKARLDYIPTSVEGMSAFKSNPEYGGSIDMSTICAKRRLATGTLDAIQRRLGDEVLTKDDFLHIREMMKERGHEVACGLCFVESSRKNLSKYNKQFLDQYKAEHPDAEIGMVDLNTVEGLEAIRSNPATADVYEAYEKFMNKLAQRKPKMFEKRTEYNHEILKKFKSDTTVGVKNRNGGLRLQSFSDFEIVHLLDMMQVITDMASVGLAGQAYTKVPDFAWALGDTGLKINLSLIAKGVDADGNLVFDDVEGMNHNEAKRLRDRYSSNVGTVVVTFTDEQLLAAMKSDFVDFIIPFHRSQWQKSDYAKLGLPEGTKDYTLHQNEKEGRKRVKDNLLPNAYWRENLSGKENAVKYLADCAKMGRTPKFAKFLVNNGDGSYSLQPDGSTDGYWKLLIDFKMYDNAGNYSKQLPVQPNFNMEQAMRMLEEYKGEHDTFPVAQDVVDDFVKEFRNQKGVSKSTEGRYTVQPMQNSLRDQQYMDAVNAGDMQKAQRMVDEAARAAGYEPLKLFHGTNAFGFTKIDVSMSDDGISFFATNKPEVAAGYVKYYDSDDDQWGKPTEIGRKADRPQRLSAEASVEDYISALGKYASDNDMFDYKNGRVATEEDRREALKPHIFQLQTEINDLKTWSMPYSMEYYVTDIEYAIKKGDYNELLELCKRRNEFNDIPYDLLGFHVYNSLSNISYAMYQVEQILSSEAAYIPRVKGQGKDTFFTKDRLRMEYNDLTSGANSGIYQVYASHEKQLVVSTNGSNWGRIRVPENMRTGVLEGKATASTREFAKWAWKNGYNSIKFEDLYDNGAYGGNDMADIYAFFTNNGPEMIKSADPVTYDDNGNIIPLSERFSEGQQDIRYSLRDLPTDMTAREFLTDADPSIASTVEERNALSIYQKLLRNHAEASERVIAAESALLTATEGGKPEARKALAAARARQKELYDRLLNVERTAHVQTVVRRTNQLIGDLSGKTQSDVDKMIADKERQIESLKADITGLKGAAKTQREADIRAVEREIESLKSKAAQSLLANSERYQQQIENLRARRDLNIEIDKKARHIKRVVKKLNDRIVHEDDYKNVKEPLKPAVHQLVRTFIDGFGNLVFDTKTADRLRTVYDAIANEDAAPEFYSDDVANWLTDLAKLAAEDEARRAGGSTLESVGQKLDTYNRVAEIADHIYKMVTAADEIFVNGKRESFAAISEEVGTALRDTTDKKLLVGKAREAARIADDLLRTGNMTPQYFFEHLRNSGLTRLFDTLMAGQTEYAQNILAGRNAVEEAKRKYNFYAWQNMKQGVEFRTEQGHTISLTTPQMMWVYATAKREATNKLMDTHHLDQGGFRYEAKDLPRQKGKLEAIPGSDRLHKLSAADVQKITDTLTAEQKACADELVSYLSNECAAQGNRASMELFGIKKYNEEYYFPFKTASDQRYQRSDAGSTSTTNDARVKHTSFTHSLRKGANTPLVMGDFFDVISDHINQMATYSSFVVPIESMNRVLNAKVNEESDGSGNDVTIRSLVARKHGEPAQKYMADLMKDLNGGPQTDNRGTYSALFRAFKRGAVMGSLSVSLQQPTAIVRAFAYVKPKYFAHITMEGNKKTWERMMKYSGTAVIKDMGKFDVGTGKMANDWIAHSDVQEYNIWKRSKFLMDTQGFKAAKDNWMETLTALPGYMDRVTWTHIWKAVEAEQAEANPGMDRNSDEFLTLVGQRFDDVVNHTQVYDSILAKSQNMRSKNPLTQMSTAFMSEPTLNINMLYSAVRGEHNAQQRAGMITSVAVSNLLAAAFASLISAWNKDDDERKFSEKYLGEFASRAVDNLNPITMIPFLSDLWNLVSGYDIERTDLSVLKDVYDYGSTFLKNARDPEKANTWRDYENFFGTLANLTGIPAKNIFRDIRRVRNLWATDKSASSKAALKYTLYENAIPLGLWDDSSKAYCQRLVAAVADGDTQEAYDLWDYLTNSKKPSQNTINTNIRDELKRRVREGSMTPSQATEILRKYAPYVNDKDNLNKPKEWAE